MRAQAPIPLLPPSPPPRPRRRLELKLPILACIARRGAHQRGRRRGLRQPASRVEQVQRLVFLQGNRRRVGHPKQSRVRQVATRNRQRVLPLGLGPGIVDAGSLDGDSLVVGPPSWGRYRPSRGLAIRWLGTSPQRPAVARRPCHQTAGRRRPHPRLGGWRLAVGASAGIPVEVAEPIGRRARGAAQEGDLGKAGHRAACAGRHSGAATAASGAGLQHRGDRGDEHVGVPHGGGGSGRKEHAPTRRERLG